MSVFTLPKKEYTLFQLALVRGYIREPAAERTTAEKVTILVQFQFVWSWSFLNECVVNVLYYSNNSEKILAYWYENVEFISFSNSAASTRTNSLSKDVT